MARKEEPRPLFELKGDFIVSLDNALQQHLRLIQAVEIALRYGAVNDTAKDDLEKQVAASRKALSAND